MRQLLISRAARPHAVVGVNVAEREVEVLKRARENFVRKRREMAEQMIPSGAAAAHFAPNFAALQIAIEALDRAIRMKGRYRRTMHPPHLSRRRCRAPRLSRPMLWMWISIQPDSPSRTDARPKASVVPVLSRLRSRRVAMRRRSFLAGAATLGAVLPSLAQTGGGAMRRIGVLANNPPSAPLAAPFYAAFYAGLNERGWVEGRNLLIEGRYAAGRMERFAELAAELVALDVEVIVVLSGAQATQAAKRATSKIPIVFAGVDPIASNFVASLARPGRNLTGVSNQLGDLVEKTVDLLRAFVPNLERVGLIWQPANSGSAQSQKDLDAAAPRLGLSVVSLELATPQDVERVFATVRETRPQVLIIHPTPVVSRVYKEIAAFAIAERLPTITGYSAYVREGLLMSYGPDLASIWRLAAH